MNASRSVGRRGRTTTSRPRTLTGGVYGLNWFQPMAQTEPTGVGTALRAAREEQGLSIEEASRDTKLRSDQLQALEDERFERLLGDVYVRGSLRSYARYL